VQPYFKIRKNDLVRFPKLHAELTSISEIVNESNDSYLYSPSPGKMSLFVDKFKAANITYNLISQTDLYSDGKLE
jgi:hypothetical protein